MTTHKELPVKLPDYEELVEVAKRNPPPQSWFEEDFSKLRNPSAMTSSRLYNLIFLAVLVAAIGWLCWEGTR
jgi:hypothetical protein